METTEDTQEALATLKTDPLTIQDALMIGALYVVKIDSENCEHITSMAQAHPLFVEQMEDSAARVNKFANWMQQASDSLKLVELTARELKPQHRQDVFAFAAEVVQKGKVLTEKKKNRLQALAAALELEEEFVNQKLADIQISES
jgi:hypothetical protein